MGWLLAGGIILLLVLFTLMLLLLLRVYTTLYYRYHNGSDYLRVEIEVFGICVFQKELTVLSEGDNRPNTWGNPDGEKTLEQKWHNWKRNLQALRSILPQILVFISKVSIHQLSWKSKLGLADARATGIAAGAGWGIKYSLVAWIRSHVKRISGEEIEIQPLFQQKNLYTEAECNFSFRLGKAIRLIRLISKQLSSV
ncbi:DUF2953 domain-containing protein [Virgibacillus senegalensis]|uniref:DUF2953 domain-containing protein n=1 Tax=Virgibacillus senegalensis TaxID=1499679 RepID=UPI00069E4DC9|nr:DUF2953 domain-containing protein [Virgibacillus senegalensis]